MLLPNNGCLKPNHILSLIQVYTFKKKTLVVPPPITKLSYRNTKLKHQMFPFEFDANGTLKNKTKQNFTHISTCNCSVVLADICDNHIHRHGSRTTAEFPLVLTVKGPWDP